MGSRTIRTDALALAPLIWLGASFAFACAGSPSGASPHGGVGLVIDRGATAPTAGPAPAESAGAPSAAGVALEPAVARTAPVGPAACVVEAAPLLPEDTTAELTLRPNGPAFARVGHAAAQVEIPLGKPRDAFVRMAYQGWHVAGHLSTRLLTIRPRRVVLHEEFLIPTRFAHLELVEAKSGRLSLTATPPPIVRRASAAAALDYACAEVNVGPPVWIDAYTALPGKPAARRPAMLRPGSIPLSVAPGAPPLASLQVTDATPAVVELERRGTHSRIAIVDSVSVFVFGWVPQAEVRVLRREDDDQTGGLGLSGSARADESSRSAPRVASYRCTRELPVRARMRDEIVEVGHVDAGTAVVVAGTGEPGKLLPPEWLELVPGVSLETTPDSLSSCRREP
jgi:hypothetical protein